VRIVIGTLDLAAPGGTQTYCVTVARELGRRGHEVILFADQLGPYADWVEESGVDVARGAGDLPPACDAVLANDAITAGLLTERYPDSRLVYCVHSTIYEVQAPPLTPGLIGAIIAPSERFAAFARAFALDVPVVRLRQPIDTEWFAPSAPPRRPPRRALLLSNVLEGPRREALVEAWTAHGIECIGMGGPNSVFDVRPAIADADIIVARGRAAMEGMACGKAVYVFDIGVGDGWVTPDSYPAIEADNFAGMATDVPVDRRRLDADLDAYDPDMGWINRELAVTYHNVRSHVQGLVDVLRGPAPRRGDSTSSAAAMARTVRFAWRMQGRASGAEWQIAQLRQQLDGVAIRFAAAEEVARTAQEELRKLREQLDGATAHVVAADEVARAAQEELYKLRGSRRVRAALQVGRLYDRARRRG
jgi:hypothetical protein